MGKWCLHASSFIFDRIIIKVAGNQDRHKSLDVFDFGPVVSMTHLYVFWNEIWPWHIGLRWAIVALWATCFLKPSMDFIHLWRDDRALSKILRSTIPIPVHGLKVKVTDFEFFVFNFYSVSIHVNPPGSSRSIPEIQPDSRTPGSETEPPRCENRKKIFFFK